MKDQPPELTDHQQQCAECQEAGFSATPTVRALDAQGAVVETWTGFLAPSEQHDVAARLGATTAFIEASKAEHQRERHRRARAASLIATEDLTSLMSIKQLTIVDTRQRYSFERGHIDNAINIPRDELAVRAPIEVPSDRAVVILCDASSSCEKAAQDASILTPCVTSGEFMISLGYESVSILHADWNELSRSGLPLVTSDLHGLPPAIMHP